MDEQKDLIFLECEVCNKHYLRVPNKNILIECQGDYWHGNQLVFKHLTQKQIKTKEKDERKRICALSQGYEVLYFWENDIINNLENVKYIIYTACVEENIIKCPKCGHNYYNKTKTGFKCCACNNEW